jgi:hypothetical protein
MKGNQDYLNHQVIKVLNWKINSIHLRCNGDINNKNKNDIYFYTLKIYCYLAKYWIIMTNINLIKQTINFKQLFYLFLIIITIIKQVMV